MLYEKSRKDLQDFIDNGGLSKYASQRNFDMGALHENVSKLSPFIRHRIISEEEVLKAALSKYPYSKIEKFVQEVFWRTYWKGWLEQRPDIWQWYQQDLKTALDNRCKDYDAAINGKTGIDCFDHWVQELRNTGYLHNHARMWFASIWIFTLKLPWVLGADFFMQNLLDGDAASNTLSWRWVAGLQTKGKTYLARADNIHHYTNGRFNPTGLANEAIAIEEANVMPAPRMPDMDLPMPKSQNVGLLITEEDCNPQGWLTSHSFKSIAAINLSHLKSPQGVASHVNKFVNNALHPYEIIDDIEIWKLDNKLDFIVTTYTPVGHVADYLKNKKDIYYMARRYDQLCWPHATKGFFAFKEKIPKIIKDMNIV